MEGYVKKLVKRGSMKKYNNATTTQFIHTIIINQA